MKKLALLLVVAMLMLSVVGCQPKPAEVGGEVEEEGAPAEENFVLKYATVTAEDHPYNTGGRKFAELVEEKTNGTVKINVYPASQLGDERDLMEGMQLGTIDFVITSLGVAASFVPESDLFNLPFLFKDADHFVEVARGPVGQRLLDEFDNVDLKGLAIGGPIFRVPMNDKRPINAPEDFKGLSFRLMEVPLHMDTYKALGASPTPIPFGELYTALQLGTVDGNENAVATFWSSKFHEVQKYMTMLPVFSNGCMLVMSKITWEKLSPNQQQAVLDSVEGGIGTLDSDYLAMDEEGLVGMEKDGLIVNTPSDIAPFQEAVKSVYDKYLSKMPQWAVDAVKEIQGN